MFQWWEPTIIKLTFCLIRFSNRVFTTVIGNEKSIYKIYVYNIKIQIYEQTALTVKLMYVQSIAGNAHKAF